MYNPDQPVFEEQPESNIEIAYGIEDVPKPLWKAVLFALQITGHECGNRRPHPDSCPWYTPVDRCTAGRPRLPRPLPCPTAQWETPPAQ